MVGLLDVLKVVVSKFDEAGIEYFMVGSMATMYWGPPIEVIQDELRRRGSFNLIHQESGIKVDLVLDKETEFYISEFARRKKVKMIEGLEVYLASPEDLIQKK